MKTKVIIIDDFYPNPMEIRQKALSMEFKVRGNFPGSRTEPYINGLIYDNIQKSLISTCGKITHFPTDDYNASFQTTFASDRSWIHSDVWNEWAGVLYLTPDAPLSGGTGTFKHKKTGLFQHDPDRPEDSKIAMEQGQDMTCYEKVDIIGNVFNRLVLFRGKSFHMSLDYFGNHLDNCRLFQVFFFDTER
jgi:hypothetical protein